MRTVVADLEFMGVPGVFAVRDVVDSHVTSITYELLLYGPFDMPGEPPVDPIESHTVELTRPVMAAGEPWTPFIEVEFEGPSFPHYRVLVRIVDLLSD